MLNEPDHEIRNGMLDILVRMEPEEVKTHLKQLQQLGGHTEWTVRHSALVMLGLIPFRELARDDGSRNLIDKLTRDDLLVAEVGPTRPAEGRRTHHSRSSRHVCSPLVV